MKIPKFQRCGKPFPNSNFNDDTYYKSRRIVKVTKHNYDLWLNTVRQENNSKLGLIKAKGYCYIRDIFNVYWQNFKLMFINRIRKTVITNVERMLPCETFEMGFFIYQCQKGCSWHYQGMTCKSRFCSKCGNKYQNQRTVKVSEKLINVPHRQFVFSMPKQYRPYFRKYRVLLNVLFQSVNDTLNFTLGNHKGIAKLEKRKFGFVSFLHTYGRDLKWNPHLHVLVAEVYVDKNHKVKKYNYFHYNQIRQTYKNFLMNNLYAKLKQIRANPKDIESLYWLNKDLHETYGDGYYVHGPKLNNQSIKKTKTIMEYVARYGAKPSISERRILNIDHEQAEVTWFYDPHEDDDIHDPILKQGRQVITESVYQFIMRLIIHIPDRYFHNCRYYGFYANKSTFNQTNSLFSKAQLKQMDLATRWLAGLLKAFGYTPLLCGECGQLMRITEIVYPERKGIP